MTTTEPLPEIDPAGIEAWAAKVLVGAGQGLISQAQLVALRRDLPESTPNVHQLVLTLLARERALDALARRAAGALAWDHGPKAETSGEDCKACALLADLVTALSLDPEKLI